MDILEQIMILQEEVVVAAVVKVEIVDGMDINQAVLMAVELVQVDIILSIFGGLVVHIIEDIVIKLVLMDMEEFNIQLDNNKLQLFRM